MRAKPAIVAIVFALAACNRAPVPAASVDARPDVVAGTQRAGGEVTIAGDDSIAAMLTWTPPAVAVDEAGLPELRRKAARALARDHLYEDADAAIPIDLAILRAHPDDAKARDNLRRAMAKLLAQGDAALDGADDDFDALRRAHGVAAVARVAAPETKQVQAFLARVDIADQAWDFNRQAEADLAAGR